MNTGNGYPMTMVNIHHSNHTTLKGTMIVATSTGRVARPLRTQRLGSR